MHDFKLQFTLASCYLGEVCYSCVEKVDLVNPKPGWVEIDPDILWNKVVKVKIDQVNSKPEWVEIDPDILLKKVSSLFFKYQKPVYPL